MGSQDMHRGGEHARPHAVVGVEQPTGIEQLNPTEGLFEVGWNEIRGHAPTPLGVDRYSVAGNEQGDVDQNL